MRPLNQNCGRRLHKSTRPTSGRHLLPFLHPVLYSLSQFTRITKRMRFRTSRQRDQFRLRSEVNGPCRGHFSTLPARRQRRPLPSLITSRTSCRQFPVMRDQSFDSAMTAFCRQVQTPANTTFRRVRIHRWPSSKHRRPPAITKKAV